MTRGSRPGSFGPVPGTPSPPRWDQPKGHGALLVSQRLARLLQGVPLPCKEPCSPLGAQREVGKPLTDAPYRPYRTCAGGARVFGQWAEPGRDRSPDDRLVSSTPFPTVPRIQWTWPRRRRWSNPPPRRRPTPCRTGLARPGPLAPGRRRSHASCGHPGIAIALGRTLNPLLRKETIPRGEEGRSSPRRLP